MFKIWKGNLSMKKENAIMKNYKADLKKNPDIYKWEV